MFHLFSFAPQICISLASFNIPLSDVDLLIHAETCTNNHLPGAETLNIRWLSGALWRIHLNVEVNAPPPNAFPVLQTVTNTFLAFQLDYDPGLYSVSKRNKYQERSGGGRGVKRARRVRMTTSPPSVSRLSRKCERSSSSQKPMGFHGLLQGELDFFTYCMCLKVCYLRRRLWRIWQLKNYDVI
jgi:hypothetical protein